MYHYNPYSAYCAICGEKLHDDRHPFWYGKDCLPVHRACGDDKQAKERLDLAKAIERAPDGPIVVVPIYSHTWLHEAIALLIAFFAGAAVATCAFLLWW